jgi:hypothetical protein
MKANKNACTLGFMLSIGSSLLFSVLCWKRSQLPYNQSGRYFDGAIVWDEQAVTAYALLTLMSLLVALAIGIICLKSKNSRRAHTAN